MCEKPSDCHARVDRARCRAARSRRWWRCCRTARSSASAGRSTSGPGPGRASGARPSRRPCSPPVSVQRSDEVDAALARRAAIASVRTAILMTEADSNSASAVVLVACARSRGAAPRRRSGSRTRSSRRDRGVDAATSAPAGAASRSAAEQDASARRRRATATRRTAHPAYASTLTALLDPPHEAGEHVARPDLERRVDALRERGAAPTRPSARASRSGARARRAARAPSVAGARVHVRHDGHARVAKRGRLEERASSSRAPAPSARSGTAPRRAAGSRAWRRAPVQRRGRARDGRRVPGDDGLLGRVEVRGRRRPRPAPPRGRPPRPPRERGPRSPPSRRRRRAPPPA